MVRFALTVLALTILPGFAVAQQPASRTHVVVEGETLWALAQRYYEDPFLWPQIFEANRSQIEDPNLIQPDQQFVIPGIAAEDSEMAAGEPAIVGGVQVSQAPDAPPGGVEAEAEEQPSERDRRSVFFRDPFMVLDGQAVADRDYLLVSRASVWSAEWLGPENTDDIESDGQIESFVTGDDAHEQFPLILPLGFEHQRFSRFFKIGSSDFGRVVTRVDVFVLKDGVVASIFVQERDDLVERCQIFAHCRHTGKTRTPSGKPAA